MGIPDEPFWAPDELVAAVPRARRRAGRRAPTRGSSARRRIDRRRGRVGRVLGRHGLDGLGPGCCRRSSSGEKIATRVAIQKAFDAHVDGVPGLVAGAADLTGNTGTKLDRTTPRSRGRDPGGRQIHFGIREHAMGAAMVGMAKHGGVLPVGGTFFVFSRLHAPGRPARGAVARRRCCSCSPTTPSASARTARRTSRSSTSPRCGRSPTCR